MTDRHCPRGVLSRKCTNAPQMAMEVASRTREDVWATTCRVQESEARQMSAVTVKVNLSAASAAFMRKCIGDADGAERDAFFEVAVGALAEKLVELSEAVADVENDSARQN